MNIYPRWDVLQERLLGVVIHTCSVATMGTKVKQWWCYTDSAGSWGVEIKAIWYLCYPRGMLAGRLMILETNSRNKFHLWVSVLTTELHYFLMLHSVSVLLNTLPQFLGSSMGYQKCINFFFFRVMLKRIFWSLDENKIS